MTENKKLFRDFTMVFLSNATVVLASVLTGLVVPKLLGVVNYGYYKTFTLYSGYTALLHFGFVDGVLLLFSGKTYEELDKKQFRLFTRFFMVTQAIVSFLIIAAGFACFHGAARFICVMVGIDSTTTNLTSYYQYVSQSTMRFKELSIRRILLAVSKIAYTVFFYCLYLKGIINVLSFYTYIFVLVFINLLLLLWYVYTYRDITFGSRDDFTTHKAIILQMYKVGIFLTISYQVANLIFSLDRQFVSLLFDTETYAVYSFAYSLVVMITTVIGSVSQVLFPTLKRKGADTIIRDFAPSMSLISILSFAIQIGYYPLRAFISWYLPDYSGSLVYLRVIFPGAALSCCITSIMFTYYKVLDKILRYFKICCMVLATSAALNGLAYFLFHSPLAISGASILTLLIWYILSEVYFIKVYHVRWIQNLIYIFLIMAGFYGITSVVENAVFGTVLYAVYFLIITWIFYRKLLITSLKSILH